MEQLTDECLNEIEARADAATSGPWFIAARTEDWIEGPEEVLAIDSCDQEGIAHLYDPLSNANGNFIAHAREDVPALAAEVRRLRAKYERQCAGQMTEIQRRVNAEKDRDALIAEVDRLRTESEDLKKSQGYSLRPHRESHWDRGSQEEV